MISKSNKKAFMKVVLTGLGVWLLFVFIAYLFSGSFKSALPFGILVLITMLKYGYTHFKIFKRKDKISGVVVATRNYNFENYFWQSLLFYWHFLFLFEKNDLFFICIITLYTISLFITY